MKYPLHPHDPRLPEETPTHWSCPFDPETCRAVAALRDAWREESRRIYEDAACQAARSARRHHEALEKLSEDLVESLGALQALDDELSLRHRREQEAIETLARLLEEEPSSLPSAETLDRLLGEPAAALPGPNPQTQGGE